MAGDTEHKSENLKLTVIDNVLTILVDLNKTVGFSKSGKSKMIATTSGSLKLPGRDEIVGLNVYKK